MSANKKYIIIYDDAVFTSPNRPDMSFKIPQKEKHIEDDIHPRLLRSINWSDNNRPYVPFMLQRNRFSSPLLRCLNHMYHTLPLEFKSGRWGLPELIVASWQTLEEVLVFASHTLATLSGHSFPLDLRHWRYPSSYQLANTFDSEKYARRRFNAARNAFFPLLAYCTYTITLYTRYSDVGISDKWYKVLIQNKLPAPIIDAIRSSEIARFNLPRAGVIIDAATCTYSNEIFRMVKADIPVYIYWGTITHITSAASLMDTSKPTREDINLVLWRPSIIEDTEDHWDPSPCSSPPPHPVITWEAWVEERKKAVANKITIETPAEKNTRENRIRAAACGPSKKSKVFYWKKDWDTGLRSRTVTIKKDFYELWRTYHKARCYFDPVSNEWDLCSEAAADFVDDDQQQQEQQQHLVVNQPLSSLSSSSPLPKVSEKETAKIFGPPKSIAASSHFPFTPMTFEQALLSRYGFNDTLLVNQQYPKDFDQKELRNVTETEWLHLTSWYTHKTSNTVLYPRARSLINYFTARMLTFNATDTSKMPSRYIWDLRPSHPHSVIPKLLGSHLTIERMCNGSNIMYEISVSNEEQQHLQVEWRLFVRNPLTVLQCIREEWGPSLKEVAVQLALIGTPFHMVKPFVNPPHPDDLPNVPWLSYRPKDYEPAISDYLQYRSMRNNILRQDSRVAAAALRAGGILWRLAMEVLNPNQVLDEDFESGCVNFHNDLWEPKLTEAEENAICGVYEVYTGSGEQTAHKSWWPKPNTWVGSGRDVGYWSTDCEQWYRQRLMLIESEMTDQQEQGSSSTKHAKLRTATEWSITISCQIKKTRVILRSHKAAADQTLAHHYLP